MDQRAGVPRRFARSKQAVALLASITIASLYFVLGELECFGYGFALVFVGIVGVASVSTTAPADQHLKRCVIFATVANAVIWVMLWEWPQGALFDICHLFGGHVVPAVGVLMALGRAFAGGSACLNVGTAAIATGLGLANLYFVYLIASAV